MSEEANLSPEELQKLREDRKKAAKEAKAAKFAAKKEQKGDANKKGGESAPAKKKEKEIRLKEEFINTTKKGEKKDLSEPMANAYSPPPVEAAWYDWWEAKGFFRPEYGAPTDGEDKREKFIMMIPPPNVTGSLHIGHALTNSIQDALARWHRMKGHCVLWVPGIDHAGIATQSVVERKLAREGIDKYTLGREAFVARVWEWKNEYGSKITSQERRTGASLDWTRECFTMDERLSRAVQEAYIRFYDSGLIYRANRLVNWSCALRTAISDLECDDLELDGPTLLKVPGHQGTYPFGSIWSFAYKVADKDGKPTEEEIVVATTRPETMLGDTAVAVHPNDPRYKHLHGRFVKHPFQERVIPIVTDDVLVDMSFGTGAVKITPAHDPNDFEVGVRHTLPSINILNENGTLNENAGPEFQGLMRFDARGKVLAQLKAKGHFRGDAPNKMRLLKCSRSGDIIEPYLKPQWYVNIDSMAARSAAAVREGTLRLVPESQEKHWFHYLDNPRPWCISRQLWWGHRIPAYRVDIEGAPAKSVDDELWVVGRTEEEASVRAREKVGDKKFTLFQDPDVLDTWFSSGLFPFATLGWPDATPDMKNFYPNTLLETGRDIIFFWVARMVMMGLQLTGQVPFKTALFHAMVRDAQGRKMSKALGNVIDPIDVIEGITLEQLHAKLMTGNLPESEVAKAKEGQKQDFPNGISECGTDALRFALCAYFGQATDINLDINRVVAYRNFCNKIWNSAKLAFMFLGDNFTPSPQTPVPENASPLDLWLLHRLNTVATACEQAFTTFEISQATTAIHGFWLHNFCDIYLEAVKPIMRGSDQKAKAACQQTIYIALDEFLRLMSPFMPYLTEEIWQRIPKRGGEPESICVAPYPQADSARHRPELDGELNDLMNIVKAARSLLVAYNINTKAKQVHVSIGTNEASDFLVKRHLQSFLTLSGVTTAECQLGLTIPPAGCATAVADHNTVLHVHLKGLVDPAQEIAKLEKKIETLSRSLEALEKKRAGPTYATKVPEDVQRLEQEKVERQTSELDSLKAALGTFQKML